MKPPSTETRLQEAQNGYDDHAAECRRLEARVRELEYACAEYFDRYHCAGRLPAYDAACKRAEAYAEFRRTVETKR